MQGAECQISGKRSMERPIMFDSRGTFFAFAGAFAGLHQLIRKRSSHEGIGFSAPSGAKTRRQQYILDAIAEYGYLKTWTNRLCSVLFLPDPTEESLGRAAAHGMLDSINAILGQLGMMLFPQPGAVERMAAYALESRTFYRGLRSVWWSIAEQAVARRLPSIGFIEYVYAGGLFGYGVDFLALPGSYNPATFTPTTVGFWVGIDPYQREAAIVDYFDTILESNQSQTYVKHRFGGIKRIFNFARCKRRLKNVAPGRVPTVGSRTYRPLGHLPPVRRDLHPPIIPSCNLARFPVCFRFGCSAGAWLHGQA
jgi:hypothetical protein